MEQLPLEVKRQVLRAQKNEITEHRIYSRLARSIRDGHNSSVLGRIGEHELGHYDFWKGHTGVDQKPNRVKVFFYFWVSRMFGITFGIKLMERGEEQAQVNYTRISRYIPGAMNVAADEEAHEEQLIGLINEQKLSYVGSIVLGLNDALVELTGALAGLSLALRDTRLIALAGLVTGVAASLSMAASEYLSTKSEEQTDTALTAALYTGVAYIGTVVLLILPYLLLDHYLVALALTLGIAIFIILAFNYYVAVARGLSFVKRFTEMASLSLGVAVISFGIGYLIRVLLGVDV